MNWNNKLDSETDPTVPSHVKNITQEDINNWNNKLDSYTEVDPSIPNYIRNITQENINNWNNKVDTTDLATVATSGSYNDLADKPTIPAAQVNADWNAASGVAAILNKPTIPVIPTNVSAFTNDADYATTSEVANQGLVLKKMLDEYCPIIEDTRSSAVAEITGVAPFATLEDGQRICLHFNAANGKTLELTLGNGTTTGAKDVLIPYQGSFYSPSNVGVPKNSYMLLRYEAANNVWRGFGSDKNNVYNTITQEQINAGTATGGALITPKRLVDNFEKRHLYVDNSADASVELSTATYNDLGTLAAWKPVTLPAAYNRGDEFVFSFECNDADLSPVLPAGVVLADGFDFSEMAVGVTYQVSIMDGVAAYLCITPNS